MIYCVEDDDDIRELMLYTLRTAGFEAQGFPDSVLFWKAMEEEQPKLILLDIMLPVDDGLTILKLPTIKWHDKRYSSNHDNC